VTRFRGLTGDALLYALSALFALFTALFSTLPPHRAWGAIAAWGYAASFLAVVVYLTWRRLSSSPGSSPPSAAPSGSRMTVTGCAFVAVAAVPLVVEVVQRAAGRLDRAQPEVLVVERMGRLLQATHTPYLSHASIAALPVDERLDAYSPYQPGMALFGLPRAWFGDTWCTDARVWFALVTVAALGWALRIVPSVRAAQAATVFPICSLTSATGGDDMPVLALCLLALAFCSSRRFLAAGFAVGCAAALKLFAFPVVVVLAVLALTNRRAAHFLPGALGLPLLALAPALLNDPDAFVENVIRFPLGHGLVASPAQSPFPGQLIASSVPAGRYVAAALLVAAVVAVSMLLILRPPRTAVSAGHFSGYGLLAAILLMPTTRFGYLLYPVALLVWAGALGARARSQHTASETPQRDVALYRL
jgi:hypothetical protein